MNTDPVKSFNVDSLPVHIYACQDDMSSACATEVNDYLCDTINDQGSAAAILATGNSQIQFLEKLLAIGEVDWSKMTLFHMDEYLGIDKDHSASFRRYMRERVEQVVQPAAFHYIQGDALEPLKADWKGQYFRTFTSGILPWPAGCKIPAEGIPNGAHHLYLTRMEHLSDTRS